MAKINLILFVTFVLLIPEKVIGKFEKIEFFLKKYEVSKSKELKRDFKIKFSHFEKAERSIEIKGFGKKFIFDLSVYYPHEDARLQYISQLLNNTGSFQDLNALLYEGQVRDKEGSYVLGFFTRKNLFRGYFMIDEVYCVEPYEEKSSVIVYKFKDVIFPGCTKMAEGDHLNCADTKYFEPWKPIKPPKEKFDYRSLYDTYLQLFNGLEAKKVRDETNTKDDSNDAKAKRNDSDVAKENHNDVAKVKNGNDTNKTNHHNDDSNHNKNNGKKNQTESHNGDDDDDGDDKIHLLEEKIGEDTEHNHTKHNHGKKTKHALEEYDTSMSATDIVRDDNENAGKNNTTNSIGHKMDTELERWTSSEKQIHSRQNNKTDGSDNNKKKNGKKNQTETDSDNEDDDEDKIHLLEEEEGVWGSKNQTFYSNQNNKTRSSDEGEKDKNENKKVKLNENISEFNTSSTHSDIKNNRDNFVENISLSESSKDWEEPSNTSRKMSRNVQKREVEEREALYYPMMDMIEIVPLNMECSLEVLISPTMRKKFKNNDIDVIKDVFMQITLLNKVFRKVVLKRKGMPFYAHFRIKEIFVYQDEFYSPFETKGDMEDTIRIFNQEQKFCFSIGLTNQLLPGGKFASGYIPKGEGGVCSKIGNFILVSHGNDNTPAPMALFFAALIRGVTRGFGANDESDKCKKGAIPNPMQVLQADLLAKKIAPEKKYSIFSECNLQEIENALKKRTCLVQLEDPLCGNAIIDDDEECDCGPEFICKKLDPCCIPHLTAADKRRMFLERGFVEKACRLVPEAKCGLFQPCCTKCDISQEKNLCYNGHGICDKAYCDGKSADCPTTKEASDGMICGTNNDTEPILCKNKKCELGLCTGFGLTTCTCAHGTGKDCIHCCLKDGKCKAAVSDLKLVKGKDFPLKGGSECIGGICTNGVCITETKLQGTNTTDRKKYPRFPATVNYADKVLKTLYSIFSAVLILFILHIIL